MAYRCPLSFGLIGKRIFVILRLESKSQQRQRDTQTTFIAFGDTEDNPILFTDPALRQTKQELSDSKDVR